MRIGIQHRKGGFSERWIKYCQENNIEVKLVNVYRNDIIEQLSDCDAFMWHFHHANYKDVQFAKSLLFTLEQCNKRVFPNFATCWHFDDKVAQKYLLEAIGAPIVPSYVFYSEGEALRWANETDFPKVFKLKGGAGASNVKLVGTKSAAKKLIRQSFGKGFKQYRFIENFKEAYRKYKQGLSPLKSLVYEIYIGLIKKYPTEFAHYRGEEKGYVYFQQFIPNNHFDIRVCVVGDKAFGLKRYTRENDFRASGSGNISYSKTEIDERCVKIAFHIARKLKSQSIALDFVFDKKQNPLIVEISYGYAVTAYDACEGYWTSDMKWHESGNFDFCGWMVKDLIQGL